MRERSITLPFGGVLRAVKAASIGVLLLALLGLPQTARAEGGELFLRLTIANEAAWLHHPGVTYPDGGGAWAYVPRFGFTASYGVTHWLSVGVGASTSLVSDVVARDVLVQGFPRSNLDARYLGVMVPFTLGIHAGRGGDWNAEVAVSGGPAFSHWEARSLEDPTGTLTRPMVPSSEWYTEWFGRVAVLAEWRGADWGALAVGPYVSASTARDVSVGTVVEAALIWPAGPFFKNSVPYDSD